MSLQESQNSQKGGVTVNITIVKIINWRFSFTDNDFSLKIPDNQTSSSDGDPQRLSFSFDDLLNLHLIVIWLLLNSVWYHRIYTLD